MGVKIALISNFSLGISDSENFLLPPNITTIGDLLRHVGEQMNFPFIAADAHDLRRDIEVSINGKDVWFYPDTLKTPLNDGDSVEVNLVPLGGG
ncbi:MAG: MoaD/ThiS family protein [Deltaproteobacteria bacterium]|nr:MAG: MoaD/ThiS family protein [Deltaproteobacteria bacterium]